MAIGSASFRGALSKPGVAGPTTNSRNQSRMFSSIEGYRGSAQQFGRPQVSQGFHGGAEQFGRPQIAQGFRGGAQQFGRPQVFQTPAASYRGGGMMGRATPAAVRPSVGGGGGRHK